MRERLSDFDATMIAEGVTETDDDTVRAAWQHLVDTGLAWQLQGWFGRTAKAMIDAGEIDPPQEHIAKRQGDGFIRTQNLARAERP